MNVMCNLSGTCFSQFFSFSPICSFFFFLFIKVKAPIAGRLGKRHSIFCINRSKCDAESRIAAIILMYVSSLL